MQFTYDVIRVQILISVPQELPKRVVRLYVKARLNMNNSISEPSSTNDKKKLVP